MKKLLRFICFCGLLTATSSLVKGSELKPVLYLSFDREEAPLQDCAGKHKLKCVKDESKPKWIKSGKFGGAIEFDGTDDCLEIMDSPDLNFGPDESFTVELWVKPNPPNAKSSSSIVRKGGANSWDIRSFSEYRLGCFFISKGVFDKNATMLKWGNFSKKWHHVAFVRDAHEKKIRMYIDGILIQEKDAPENSDFFNAKGFGLKLGKWKNGFYKGAIDELAIFKGAKRRFNLKQTPLKPINSDLEAEYKPAEPVIEKPDPMIAASWEILKKYNLNLVPSPKKIETAGKKLEISPETWSVQTKSKNLEAGISLINKRLKIFGGKELTAPLEEAGKNRIIIGIYDDLKDLLPVIGNPERPPSQGYIIDSADLNGKKTIIIAGADKKGALYGCVTFAQLLNKGERLPELCLARITDWPDFKYRVAYGLPHNLNIDISKKIIDYAFLGKQNIVYENAMYQYVKDMIATAKKRKQIYDYAEARGIKIFLWQHASVEEAPKFDPVKMPGYSYLYYPYKTEEGLLANSQYSKGRAYTWCRDDLINKRGMELSELLKKTGADILFLHSMDCGGIDNPGNWNRRTPMDKKRWGNDKAAAEANLMNRIYGALKKTCPEAILIFVEYPYGPAYLKYPEIAEWLKRLSALLNKDIYYCVRETTRSEMEKWMKATEPHPNFIYHEPWPWSYRLFFSCSGRYARTFYFKNREKDIYQFAPGSGIDMGYVFSPQIMVSAEYSWNTEAPGWGWLTKDSDSIPRADERVPEITEILLPRVLSIFYGKKAAPYMAEAFKINISGRLPSNLSQFTGASFLGYFKFKAREGEIAVKKLEEAAAYIPPEARRDFKQTLDVFRIAAKLNKVKYMQLEARNLLADNKLTEAETLMKNAKEELESIKMSDWLTRSWATPLKKELDIAGSIKWFREKGAYLKQIKPEKIKVGVYNKGWYKGIVYGLNKAAGMNVGIFEEPNTLNMSAYDAVIFNACKNTGDVYGDWRGDLRKYVEEGGIAIFTHNAVGREPTSSFGKPVFPEICEGFHRQIMKEPELTLKKDLDEKLKSGTKYEHEYFDHLTVNPGKKSEILAVNKFNDPVMVGGKVGKGYVIYTGEIFGLNKRDNDSDPKGDNWKVLFHMIRHAKKQCNN